MSVAFRAARDGDCPALIALIERCWAEYPGCVVDVDGDLPELRAIASHFAALGGRFWVAVTDDDALVGSVGIAPTDAPGTAELHKLYVDPGHRRRGLGARLAALAEGEARAWGATTITLWTDTRFDAAHGFYEALGYVRRPGSRQLDDASRSVEYRYVKSLL